MRLVVGGRIAPGAEGTIKRFQWLPAGTVGPDGVPYTFDIDVIVDFDNYGRRASHTSRLEPIHPERNQVISWSECLWQPEKEEVA